MKFLSALLLTFSLFLSHATLAKANNLLPKIHSFDFLVDYSGSMMMSYEDKKVFDGNKLEALKMVLTKVNSMIPNLGYSASMHTFSPPSNIVPYALWDKANMNKGIQALDAELSVFDRRTGIGDGMFDYAPQYAQMKTPSVLIIASDGDNNVGIDPVYEARALLIDNPNLCLHVISFADTPKGLATLQEIASLKPCSVFVNGLDILTSNQVAEDFVQKVFYNIEEVIILRGVNFAFDSAELTYASKAILDHAAMVIAETGKRVTLEGYTDSLGSENYNHTLSIERAEAVQNYLISQGVPAHLLSSVGRGISHKYDNSSEEGRYLNRRTEVLFN